jgi:CHAT domain-containing protein
MLFLVRAMTALATPAMTVPSCTEGLGAPAATAALQTPGSEPVAVLLALAPGHTYLIEVGESQNDALVEILDPQNQILVQADHPERRTGTRRAVIRSGSSSVRVRVTGKNPAGAAGTAAIRAFDLTSPAALPECIKVFTALGQADADYAAAEKIARGAPESHGLDARATYARAAAGYAAAEKALGAPPDQELRGQAALAVAAVDYFNLQDWSQAAEWAQTAIAEFGSEDPYRRARAETVRATAWMELGSPQLVRQARVALQELARFHLARGERYDAALQTTSIALTYLYEGRYTECAAASVAAGRVFGSIHEPQRQAQAWQNQAVCLWGQGRLPEALRGFERASRAIGPDAVPGMYLALTNNTALVNYALGHFDEALRLFDRALVFAEQAQSPRDQAQSLSGIGVTYYALGDRDRARQFLERALAIRTVAFDSRGRMATLRSLANVDAEQGRVLEALRLDHEALALALAPSAVARIRIQTAVHTASAGRLVEAEALLDSVLADGKIDPLIEAEGLLQRAIVRCRLGRLAQAQADLAIARPRLHGRGPVTEAFEADLELAHVLQLEDHPQRALDALEEALTHADLVRMQTANPELRMQLGTPLRAAYELKVDLLREGYEAAAAAGKAREAAVLAAASFAAADASRARSLADFAAQEYPPELRSALAPEFARRAQIYQELAAHRFALESKLDRSGSEDPHAREVLADIAELQRQADTVNTVIAHAARVQKVAGQAGSGHASLPAVPPDTALVSYWLGKKSAYVWVVLPGSIRWERLRSPETVGDAAVQFHRSLERLVDTPPDRRLKDAGVLYELIVRPVESALANVRQWVIIPDGALNYVPFAALRSSDADPQSFVALRHDVAITPAAWMVAPKPPISGIAESRRLLLIADPVYRSDDPRLRAVPRPPRASQASVARITDAPYQDLQRLPFTAEEARRILAEFVPSDVDELKGLQATRERLLSLNWSRYRYIHIAAHAVVDTQVPQLSALILGAYNDRGEPVEEAVRVSDLSLQTLSADVAVLSACDTAIGPQVASEGTYGLESTLLARGARAVVASLWPVSDEMSAQLMSDFYRHLIHDAMSAPEALGAAMRTAAARERSSDPALWAGFQVSVTTLGPSHDPQLPRS